MQIYDGRESFYQWDLNQKITSDAFEVDDMIHFFNMRQTNALVVKAYELDGVVVADVPNILLQTALPITAWKYVYDEHSAQTVMEDTFKVEQRPQPYDYFYTETELYELRKEVVVAINELNGIEEALTTSEQARVVAEEERASNESDRVVAEVERENAEEDRVDAEAIRVENENARNNAESNRVTAEQSRVEAETNRAFAEQERIVAEEIRKANFETLPNNIGNAIKGYASGEFVRVDDVSPIEHTAKVKVSGKNLLPYPYLETSRTENGVTFTALADGGISVSGNPTDYVHLILYNGECLAKEGTLTFSLLGEFENVAGDISLWHDGDSTAQTFSINEDKPTVTVDLSEYSTIERLNVTAKRRYNGTEMSGVVYPQIEVGDTATAYEPYIDPTTVTLTVQGANGENVATYTPAADGTVNVASLSPTMVLSTDTEGVTIDLEYNRDTNKVVNDVREDIRALDNAIAELAAKTVLVDKTTGKSYTLYVSNGKLMLAESEV